MSENASRGVIVQEFQSRATSFNDVWVLFWPSQGSKHRFCQRLSKGTLEQVLRHVRQLFSSGCQDLAALKKAAQLERKRLDSGQVTQDAGIECPEPAPTASSISLALVNSGNDAARSSSERRAAPLPNAAPMAEVEDLPPSSLQSNLTLQSGSGSAQVDDANCVTSLEACSGSESEAEPPPKRTMRIPTQRKLTRIRSDLRDPSPTVKSLAGQNAPPHETAAAIHEVCGQSPCICPEKVLRILANANVYYTLPGQGQRCWFRYREQDGKQYGGCQLCLEWAGQGNTLHPRQSLGRFALRVDNENNHPIDTIDRHVAKPSGDHAQAFKDARRSVAVSSVADSAVESVSVGAPVVKPTRVQSHVVYMACVCLRRGLSAGDYRDIVQASYAIGAELPHAYLSETFYGEVTDDAGAVLFRNSLRAVKKSPVLSVGCDEGTRTKSYFTLRVHFLDAKFRPQTEFWQVRCLVGEKDHKALCEQVRLSFQEPPSDRFSSGDMLSPKEFAIKIQALQADGAPAMGTQRGGRPLSVPLAGPVGNLAHSLAQAKEVHTTAKMLTIWCAPHRLDLVATAIEDHPITAPLLSMVRRLSAHIKTHARAQGVLAAIHKLFSGEDAGSAGKINFAPHRFLSHAKPAKTVCLCYLDIFSYTCDAMLNPRNAALYAWGRAMYDEMKPFKSWLVLAGVGDVLFILHVANLKTQRSALRILEVDSVLATFKRDLHAYFAPTGPMRRALEKLGQPAPRDVDSGGWLLDQVCQRAQIKRDCGELKAFVKPASHEEKFTFSLESTTLTEVQKALQEIATAVQADIDIRFANTGILRFLYLLDPVWDVSASQGPEQECKRAEPALAAWAGHFSMSLELLTREWVHVHHCRLQHLAGSPASRTLPVHEFWPPIMAAQWDVARGICFCIASFVVLSFQNAEVERDIGIVKKVDERSAGQLGQTRLDARARIALQLPAPAKKRGEPVTGVIRTIAKEWCGRRRRQHHPLGGAKSGPQGRMPQRGQRRAPGPLVQAVAAPPQEGRGSSLNTSSDGQDVDIAELLG